MRLFDIRWSERRALTTRSIIFDKRERLEIGRQLDSSSLSKVGFLRRGDMTDSLRVSGLCPSNPGRYACSV